MQRLLTIASATFITVTAVATASAEPATLTFTGGLGVETMSACEDDGSQTYGCSGTTHTVIGPAPMVAISYIKKTTPKRGFALRFGPELTGSVVGGDDARGVLLGGMMTVGVHFHRVFVETGGGISALSFKADNVSERSGTIYAHYGAGIDLTPELALTGRIDIHVMMHGTMNAVLAAGGLTYTPR